MTSPIRPFRPLAALALVSAATLAAPAAAQDPAPAGVRLELTYPAGTRPGVLVLPVAGESGDSVRAILMRDFDHGNRLTVIGNAEDPTSSPVPAGGATNYPLYARLGAAVVVQPSLTGTSLSVSVHDVASRRVARTRAFPIAAAVNSPDWRMALHTVADEIEQWVTGMRGVAASQIAFVRGGQIYVTHSDGAATRAVVRGDGIMLSPTWSPDGRRIAYSVLGDAGTQVMVRDVSGGSPRRVSGATGMNITPVFSPDGRMVVYSHAQEVGADLYAAPLDGGPRRRITTAQRAASFAPSFSPDGRQIAFASDRTGSSEIWVTSAEGGTAEILTPFQFGDQNFRSSPAWSPDNRQIAFHAQFPGGFQLMTMMLRDRAVKQHTSEGVNEDPSWAPDGRHVVFTSTRSGARHLWVLDTESGRTRQLTRGASGARLAEWSGWMGGAASAASAAALR